MSGKGWWEGYRHLHFGGGESGGCTREVLPLCPVSGV